MMLEWLFGKAEKEEKSENEYTLEDLKNETRERFKEEFRILREKEAEDKAYELGQKIGEKILWVSGKSKDE